MLETQNPDTGSQTEADQAETIDETAALQDIHEIEDMMGNLMYVLKDQNATIDALRKRFPTKTSMTPEHIIPFSSDRKYSGAVFEDRGTYLMGAAQFLFQREEKKSWMSARNMHRKDFESLHCTQQSDGRRYRTSSRS